MSLFSKLPFRIDHDLPFLSQFRSYVGCGDGVHVSFLSLDASSFPDAFSDSSSFSRCFFLAFLPCRSGTPMEISSARSSSELGLQTSPSLETLDSSSSPRPGSSSRSLERLHLIFGASRLVDSLESTKEGRKTSDSYNVLVEPANLDYGSDQSFDFSRPKLDPPSTGMIDPVTWEPALEERKSARPAMSGAKMESRDE